MKIDSHAHLYPQDYLERLEKLDSRYKIQTDLNRNKIIVNNGSRLVTITEQMTSIDKRLEEMDVASINKQVLSLSIPNVYLGERKASFDLAKLSNDYYTIIKDNYPDQFLTFASVPLPFINESIKELDRAILELKMNGIVLGTNIDGRYLDDPEFQPFFERANELKTTIFLHPMSPIAVEHMQKYSLAPLVGFIFDTTVSLARMVYSGMVERFSKIKFIVPHLGGAIPYLFGRLDIGWIAYPECSENLSDPPSNSLKKLYYDVVSLHVPSLMCAYDSVGAEKMLFGTDYPHVIGNMLGVIKSVKDLNISKQEKEQIFSQNILGILNNV